MCLYFLNKRSNLSASAKGPVMGQIWLMLNGKEHKQQDINNKIAHDSFSHIFHGHRHHEELLYIWRRQKFDWREENSDNYFSAPSNLKYKTTLSNSERLRKVVKLRNFMYFPQYHTFKIRNGVRVWWYNLFVENYYIYRLGKDGQINEKSG